MSVFQEFDLMVSHLYLAALKLPDVFSQLDISSKNLPSSTRMLNIFKHPLNVNSNFEKGLEDLRTYLLQIPVDSLKKVISKQKWEEKIEKGTKVTIQDILVLFFDPPLSYENCLLQAQNALRTAKTEDERLAAATKFKALHFLALRLDCLASGKEDIV